MRQRQRVQLQAADARPDRDRVRACDPWDSELTDIGQLVELIAPRPLLLLSATEDRYSADTPEIVQAAARAYREAGAPQALQHYRAQGGHALTEERFDAIVDWVTTQMSENQGIARSQP